MSVCRSFDKNYSDLAFLAYFCETLAYFSAIAFAMAGNFFRTLLKIEKFNRVENIIILRL